MACRGGDWKKEFADYIIGKVVMTRYNNLCYKVDDVAFNMNPMSTFDRNDSEVLTFFYITIQFFM